MVSDITSLQAGLEVHAVTPDRWPDLEKLFGPRGAFAGCWCMWWRLSRSEFGRQTAAERKTGLKDLVDSGHVPGILAYLEGEPIAWCSVAPREEFASLERSRTLKRVDDRPVWSIVCFFVARPYRRQGLMARLLRSATAYAAGQGAKIVEGYPVESRGERPSSGWASSEGYMGDLSTFKAAGFVEVARRSERQPVVRFYVEDPASFPNPE